MTDINDLFIRLTQKLHPHNKEFELAPILRQYGCKRDEFGNYYKEIHTDSWERPNTLFCCHLDTYDLELDKREVTHVFDGHLIRTDGSSNLGADDKAGVCVMMKMIERQIPGFYYFFIGEECGCIGSYEVSKNYTYKFYSNIFPLLYKCIAFDRTGYHDVITHQRGEQCASIEFATTLSEQLNKFGFKYSPNSNGISSDSAEFMNQIPECTNISMGYFHQHTVNEYQDITFLKKLANALCEIDWQGLPIGEM